MVDTSSRLGDSSDTLSRRVDTHSEAETQALGRRLGLQLEPGGVVLISGDLGAGKTAFVRGIAEGLGIAGAEVSSPTFTLIQEYRGGRLRMYHVDLYRLTSKEVDDLGLDDLMLDGGAVAVEWPDRLPREIAGALRVDIQYIDDATRTITIER